MKLFYKNAASHAFKVLFMLLFLLFIVPCLIPIPTPYSLLPTHNLFFMTALAQEPAKEKGADLSKPVASVNGVNILARELRNAINERLPETGHLSLSEKRLFEIRMEVLNKLIVEEILFQESKRLKIKAAPEAIEAQVKKLQARFRSEADYREALKNRGLTPADVRAESERRLVIQKLSEQEVASKVMISDEEMRNYYNGHLEQFNIPQRVRLRLLLIGVDPASLSEDWEKARAKAQGLADRVKKGEDFTELIRQFSDDTEMKANGGDTGLLHEGQLPYSELESVAYTQEVGLISEPVQILYGHVLFRVEEKKPTEQLSFDNLNKDLLRKEMEKSATEAKFQDWAAGLRSKAEIKIF